MRSLVNLNAGPGALTERRIPRLILGAANGIGATVPVTTRFEPLLDVLRRVADAGGTLNFAVQQVNTDLVFTVTLPRHREAQVRYSRDSGNIETLSTAPQAPAATVALVGGSGEGISRPVREVISADAAPWGRMEVWVSQPDSNDDPQLDQAGRDALADGAEQLGLSVTALSRPGQAYGVDYQVGDYVGVVAGSGAAIAELVTAVRIEASPEEAEKITPTIGEGSTKDSDVIRAVRAVERRVGQMERS